MYVYDCALGGSYVGTQKRACILGETDGEWQAVQGSCIATSLIIILVLVAIVIIVVAIFILVRVTGRARAVGGVKGKSGKASGSQRKSLSKKGSSVKGDTNKAVKV